MHFGMSLIPCALTYLFNKYLAGLLVSEAVLGTRNANTDQSVPTFKKLNLVSLEPQRAKTSYTSLRGPSRKPFSQIKPSQSRIHTLP